MHLNDKINNLLNRLNELDNTVEKLTRENIQLRQRVQTLEKKNNVLSGKLHKKNSNNSSVPPSKDKNRVKPYQALRNKTGRKNGGQKGHNGKTLKMKADPDQTVMHKPNHCQCCGESLSEDQVFKGRRQVIDIPQIKPITTEHQV